MPDKSKNENPTNQVPEQATQRAEDGAHEIADPPYAVSWETLAVHELEHALKISEECGCNPRNSRPDHSNGIADSMIEGAWRNGIPDIVCFCAHGGIGNGRHRCIAAVKAKLPLSCWVGRNVPIDVLRYADIGLKRTPADALASRGVTTYRAALGAAVRLLRLYDTQRSTHWSRWATIRYTAPKIGQLYDDHYSNLTDVIEKARQIESGTNCCPSAAYAFAYLLNREGGQPKLAEIAYGLAGGTADINDVLARTRTRLSREARNRGKKADSHRAPYELGLMITAVMAREAGRKHFSFGESSPMPDLYFTDSLQVAV